MALVLKIAPRKHYFLEQLESQFKTHISKVRRFKKTNAEFMAIWQGDSEPLRQFIERFNNESLQLADRSEDFFISVFINGLKHEKLYRDLIFKPPHTMTNLLEQAYDFARRKREETRQSDKGKGKSLFTKKRTV